MILVIDDDHNGERLPQFHRWFGEPQVLHVTTAQEGYDRLANPKLLDAVFLDHDLGEKPGDMTMMQLADKIVAEGLQPGAHFIVHSMNPVGAQAMQRSLKKTHQIDICPMKTLAENLNKGKPCQK